MVSSKLENYFQIMNWYVKYKLKMDLTLGENYRNINGCKTFAASMAQTLFDKQVIFKILSYKLGLGKSLITDYWTGYYSS